MIFRLMETLEKIVTGQRALTSEVKALRQEMEGLQRRMTAISSIRQPGKTLPSSRESVGALNTQSWASILLALILYSFLQWLIEKVWS